MGNIVSHGQPRKAIAVLRDNQYQSHGTIKIEELPESTHLLFTINLYNLPYGQHGFHLHSSGNEEHAPESLCAHYNPDHNDHGKRNDPYGHRGDFGNIYVSARGICKDHFVIKTVTYSEVLGRSLIVHEDEDDLGRGPYEDSKTTGHSGKRLLFGIVGVNEDCH